MRPLRHTSRIFLPHPPTRGPRTGLVTSVVLALATALGCATGAVDRNDEEVGGRAEDPETLEPGETQVALDLSEQHQVLEGFGAAAAWYAEWLSTHPNRQEMYDLLFAEGGLDILRFRNVYRYSAEGFEAAQSSVDIYEQATRSLGYPPRVLLSSWSPPAAMKDNGKEDCREEDDGDSLCTLIKEDGEFVYEQFATYWRDSLDAYAQLGIEPDYISIQNEPDFTPNGWEGCPFKPTEQGGYPSYPRALAEVVEYLDGISTMPKILGPETIGATPSVLENYAETIDESLVYGWAHHLYNGDSAWTRPDNFRASMREIRDQLGEKPLFMTEYSSACSLGDEACDPAEGSFETAWLIHNSLVEENIAGYIYWELIWPGKGLLSPEPPWDPALWSTERGYTVRPHYYALKHYAAFTDPGDVRTGAHSEDDAVRVSAFINPDQSQVTMVLLNTAQEYTVTLELGDFDFSSGQVFQSTADDPWRKLSDVSDGDSITLPRRSISTVVLLK